MARTCRKGQTRRVQVFEFYSNKSKVRKRQEKKERLKLRPHGVLREFRERMSRWDYNAFRDIV